MHSSVSGSEQPVLQAKHKKTKSQLSFTTMSHAAAGEHNSVPAQSLASSVAKTRVGASGDNAHTLLGKQPNFGPVHYHNNSGGVVQGGDLSTEAMMIDSGLPR